MAAIVFPMGERLSSPTGEFCFSPPGNPIAWMMTVQEIRRERLQLLVTEHGQMANLCEALGFARSDTARLTRIANANIRHERDGKPYVMGDELARQIEEKLELERGWMDTPVGYEFADPKMSELHRVAQELEPYQIEQLITIGSTLAQKPSKDLHPAGHSSPDMLQNRSSPPARGTGLAPVRGVAAKKIGRGLFGPPADEPNRGASSESSSGNRSRSRKGHAGGRR